MAGTKVFSTAAAGIPTKQSPTYTSEVSLTLGDVGFCSTQAELSRLVQTLNGETPLSTYKSEMPTVVAEDIWTNKDGKARSTRSRMEFESGVREPAVFNKLVSENLAPSISVVRDVKQSTGKRAEAVADIQSVVDMLTGSAIEELTNGSLLKNSRAYDKKIVEWVTSSVRDIRTAQNAFIFAANGDVNNVDRTTKDLIALASEFKANCAALANAR